jgi:ABC-type oligopeptide transport system substrate-binding subunit
MSQTNPKFQDVRVRRAVSMVLRPRDSKSPGNRLKINDPKLDEWADAQRFELNPQRRKEIFKRMWDHELDVMYRRPLSAQHTFVILQPWLRGVRFGGQFGTNTEFYDWGDQIHRAWIDK